MAKQKTKYPYGSYDYTVSIEGQINLEDHFTRDEWESKSDSDKLEWLETRADTEAHENCLTVAIELAEEIKD
jgi:hypothetical protein